MLQLTDSNRRSLYRIAGIAALLAVLLALLEIGVTFLPGGDASLETVLDWFTMFHDYPLMALRDLGLVNMGLQVLTIPTFLALYIAHREVDSGYAVLATIIAFVGVTVFFATNRAFPMLTLSRQYITASNDAQRAALIAAGQALLAVGKSHTPGTFIAFSFPEVAGLVLSIVMLRGHIFSKTNAYVGILGFTFMLIFEVLVSFVAGLDSAAMLLAMPGGILSMVWYVLLALKLFKLEF